MIKFDNENALRSVAIPGFVSERNAVIISYLALLVLFPLDVLTGSQVSLHILYGFPLVLIALHCANQRLVIGAVTLAILFQFVTLTTYGDVSLASKVIVAILVASSNSLIVYVARSARASYLENFRQAVVLDNSPLGIWYSGLDGRYRFVNMAFCEAFGVQAQQFKLQLSEKIIGIEASSKLARSDIFCLRNNQPIISRETIELSDGKPHLLQITKIRLSDSGDNGHGIIGIMIDITEAFALQEALQKSRDEMESRVIERTHDLLTTKNQLEQEMTARKILERKVLEISEEAQAQIGRELHDDLGQLLTGDDYLSGSLPNRLLKTDQTASEQASVLKGIAQDAIKRSRYISHSLIPFNVANRGLRQGLEQFAEDVVIVSGIPCELHFSGDVEIIDFMIATNLYRITQEAINNAVKHSKASHLSIDLYTDSKQILLTISDNGVGLPRSYADETKGFGMLNMYYRAQLIGAKLTVNSSEGGGTKISLDLPLSENS